MFLFFLQYHYSQAASNNNNNNNVVNTTTASRQELQQRVIALESMTQELYKASTERLLKTFNGEAIVAMSEDWILFYFWFKNNVEYSWHWTQEKYWEHSQELDIKHWKKVHWEFLSCVKIEYFFDMFKWMLKTTS